MKIGTAGEDLQTGDNLEIGENGLIYKLGSKEKEPIIKKWTINDFFNIKDVENEDHQIMGVEFSCRICGFTFIELPTTDPIKNRNYQVGIMTGIRICIEPEKAEDHIMKYHIKEIIK